MLCLIWKVRTNCRHFANETATYRHPVKVDTEGNSKFTTAPKTEKPFSPTRQQRRQRRQTDKSGRERERERESVCVCVAQREREALKPIRHLFELELGALHHNHVELPDLQRL